MEFISDTVEEGTSAFKCKFKDVSEVDVEAKTALKSKLDCSERLYV